MRTLLLAALAATTLSGAAAAAEPQPDGAYEGRPIPDFIKRLLWDKACDFVNKKSIDCAVERCIFKDSQGAGFEPEAAPWQHATMFEWPFFSTSLTPALVEGKLAQPDGPELADPRTALGFLSGLQVDTNPDDYLVQLNPAVIRWARRELIPEPSTPMCGQTAQAIYDGAFKHIARQGVDIYAQLKTKGLIKSVKVPELQKNFDNQRGRLHAACDAIAKKAPEDEQWARNTMCWWWLRRAATGSADELALLFGKVLEGYDPEAFGKYAKAFPKPVPLKPTKDIRVKAGPAAPF